MSRRILRVTAVTVNHNGQIIMISIKCKTSIQPFLQYNGLSEVYGIYALGSQISLSVEVMSRGSGFEDGGS